MAWETFLWRRLEVVGEKLLGTWSHRGSVDVVTGVFKEQRGARALTSKEHRGTWKLQEGQWELVVSLLG